MVLSKQRPKSKTRKRESERARDTKRSTRESKRQEELPHNHFIDFTPNYFPHVLTAEVEL